MIDPAEEARRILDNDAFSETGRMLRRVFNGFIGAGFSEAQAMLFSIEAYRFMLTQGNKKGKNESGSDNKHRA